MDNYSTCLDTVTKAFKFYEKQWCCSGLSFWISQSGIFKKCEWFPLMVPSVPVESVFQRNCLFWDNFSDSVHFGTYFFNSLHPLINIMPSCNQVMKPAHRIFKWLNATVDLSQAPPLSCPLLPHTSLSIHVKGRNITLIWQFRKVVCQTW